MKIYHNPRCSKSRQTLAIIEEKGIEVEIIKYLENIPNKSQLKEIINLLGIKPLQLVRKNEADWKNNFKGQELNDDEIIEAMITYPKLIERPIVIKGNKAVLGRPPESVLNLF